jgi:metal transporter CNNM
MGGGSEQERQWAARIYPIRKNGNLLLCTLLLGNVAVNAALSILMADITTGAVGFLSSTILIVIFGEIVPQALCSRHALRIGSAAALPVRILMVIMYPATKPLSMALDYTLGEEMGTLYSKSEFKKLVELHHQKLRKDEAKIMEGALDFANRPVEDIMTPANRMYKLEVHCKLDFALLSEIFKSGYSRIPIYDETTPHHTIVGLLYVKDLILIDPEDAIPLLTIINFYGRETPRVFPDTHLSELLEIFKSGKSHMAIVQDVNSDGPGDPYYYTVGLVTLEDIIEDIIRDKIADEYEFNDSATADDIKSGTDMNERRVKIFDRRRLLPDSITPQERSAIFHHLRGTVPMFAPGQSLVTDRALKRLLTRAVVVDVKQKDELISSSAGDTIKIPAEDGGTWMYVFGRNADSFSLLLDGRAKIYAGRQQFESEIGRWTVLCPEVLERVTASNAAQYAEEDQVGSDSKHQDDRPVLEPFKADFSAECTEKSRVLRISQVNYAQAILESMQEVEEIERTGSFSGTPVVTQKTIRLVANVAALDTANSSNTVNVNDDILELADSSPVTTADEVELVNTKALSSDVASDNDENNTTNTLEAIVVAPNDVDVDADADDNVDDVSAQSSPSASIANATNPMLEEPDLSDSLSAADLESDPES